LALNLEQKKAIVAEVADVASSAYSAIAAEYRGLTVEELTALRKEARNAGVYLRVVKNTLARRAVEDTDFACMQEGFVGPLMLAFSQEDPGEMPTYEQAVSMLMGTMMAPVQKLVTTLNEIPGKLVRTVAAIRDAKEAG